MIPWFVCFFFFFVKIDFFIILWTLKKWLFWYQCTQNSFHEQFFSLCYLHWCNQSSSLTNGFTSLLSLQIYPDFFTYERLHLFARFSVIPLQVASSICYLYRCTQNFFLTSDITSLLLLRMYPEFVPNWRLHLFANCTRLTHLRTALPLSTNNNSILLDIRIRLPPYLK